MNKSHEHTTECDDHESDFTIIFFDEKSTNYFKSKQKLFQIELFYGLFNSGHLKER